MKCKSFGMVGIPDEHRTLSDMEIRELRLPDDAPALAALDTSFTTERVYDVDARFQLTVRALATPLTKRYPLDLSETPCDAGFVALDGGATVGLVATAYQAWNRRLVVWHLYVQGGQRRRGIGRRLVERALALGARRGALTAWLETSNLNLPAVEAYRRMGFELCGLDTTLYRGTSAEGEVALFLARDLLGLRP